MSTTVDTSVGTANHMVLNMGPQHPSTHGVLRVILELDGEIVVKAEPVMGYLHTGIEKSCARSCVIESRPSGGIDGGIGKP